MYENADFSPDTIKSSIKEGEAKTNELLKRSGESNSKRD
jgi:hypothetical protein